MKNNTNWNGLSLLIFFFTGMLLSCTVKSAPVPESLITLMTQAQEAPQNMSIQAEFILEVMRHQQQYQGSHLNIELLENVANASIHYAEVDDGRNPFQSDLIHIYQAMARILQGSYYNAQRRYGKAVSSTSEGIRILDAATEENPSRFLFHMYRAINYVNLPDLFGKDQVPEEDIATVMAHIRSTNSLELYTDPQLNDAALMEVAEIAKLLKPVMEDKKMDSSELSYLISYLEQKGYRLDE